MCFIGNTPVIRVTCESHSKGNAEYRSCVVCHYIVCELKVAALETDTSWHEIELFAHNNWDI